MVRLSLSVSDPQYERLLKCAHRLGISIGELIRRILDECEDES